MSTKYEKVYEKLSEEFRRRCDAEGRTWVINLVGLENGEFFARVMTNEPDMPCPTPQTLYGFVVFLEWLVRYERRAQPKERPAILVVLDVPLLHGLSIGGPDQLGERLFRCLAQGRSVGVEAVFVQNSEQDWDGVDHLLPLKDVVRANARIVEPG